MKEALRARRWLMGLAALSCGASSAADDPMLRYRLYVGERIVYERRTQTRTLEGRPAGPRRSEQIELWLFAQQGDEWQVLGYAIPAGGAPDRVHVALLYMDPQGLRRLDEGLGVVPDEIGAIQDVLPELPSALNRDRVWTTAPDGWGRFWSCTRHGPDERFAGHVRVEFEMQDPSGVSAALGLTRSGVFWFDRARGIVSRVEMREVNRALGVQTDAVSVLRARVAHDRPWCEKRLDDIRSFLRTVRHEQRWIDELSDVALRAEETLLQLDRLWPAYEQDLERGADSPFETIAAARRRMLQARRAEFLQRASLAGQWLGHVAPAWSVSETDGRQIESPAMLEPFVVECFWSLHSMPSVRAFDLLRQAQRRLGTAGLAVVCCNIDPEADRQTARLLAESCGRELLHAWSAPPDVPIPVESLPVIRLLDGERTVRRIWFGWRPSLAEEIGRLMGR